MFSNARLRLTAWYLVILAVIVGLLSFAIYQLLRLAQQAELHEVGGPGRHTLVHAFARDEVLLAYQIVAVDLVVLVLAAIGAYHLAGRTLRPIEEAMDRQRRFAAAASHELRTPLTALQGNLEVALLSPRSTAEYQDILRDAVEDTERMGLLVRDLMAVARAESEAASLSLQPLDMREVAMGAVDAVRPLASQKDLDLEVALDGPLPVRGDAVKLRLALVNLLDNAVAYTPRGGTIRLIGRHERGQVQVEVRDTGQGIAPEHLPHLFEPFYQADAARSDIGHVGLGLSLANAAVRAHGGHIDVQSVVDVGTAFTVALPAMPGTARSGVPS